MRKMIIIAALLISACAREQTGQETAQQQQAQEQSSQTEITQVGTDLAKVVDYGEYTVYRICDNGRLVYFSAGSSPVLVEGARECNRDK